MQKFLKEKKMRNSANVYINHLFNEDTDGYIQLVHLKENDIKIYNTTKENIKDVVYSVRRKKDVFITPNTYYKPSRASENIRQFRALYIDLDCGEDDYNYCFYEVFKLAEEKKIPKPTLVVFSGRGLHLYWRIKHSPSQALWTWQSLEDMLYYNLKNLKADKRAIDSARILRLPGTINSRSNEKAIVLYEDLNIEYSMKELKEEYIATDKKIYKYKKEYNKMISNVFFNSYSLHYKRLEDLKALAIMRDYNLKGFRNTFVHLFVYWQGLYTRDLDKLKELTLEFNSKIKPTGLKENQINSIIKSCNKQIEKFIEYNNQEKKEIIKGAKNKRGYWYKNQTLIEILEITEEEQKKLSTVIAKKEKYLRKNIKRNAKNKDENGKTSKQKELEKLKEEVLKLKQSGLSIRKIAKKLNITHSKVQRLIS